MYPGLNRAGTWSTWECRKPQNAWNAAGVWEIHSSTCRGEEMRTGRREHEGGEGGKERASEKVVVEHIGLVCVLELEEEDAVERVVGSYQTGQAMFLSLSLSLFAYVSITHTLSLSLSLTPCLSPSLSLSLSLSLSQTISLSLFLSLSLSRTCARALVAQDTELRHSKRPLPGRWFKQRKRGKEEEGKRGREEERKR